MKEFKSIRYRNRHISPDRKITLFKSVNEAKRHSRSLGGAGHVIVVRDVSELARVLVS